MKILCTNRFFAISVLFWTCNQLAHASGFDSPECRKYLHRASKFSPYENIRAHQLRVLADLKAAETSRNYVSFDSTGPIDDRHAVKLIKDPRYPFYLIEPLRPVSVIQHELHTAGDYARFIASSRDEVFVFIAEVDKISVPFFDGITVHSTTGQIRSSVSLKYSSPRLPHEHVEVLDSLAKRFDLEADLHNLLPWVWFLKTNNLGSYGRDRDEPFYIDRFDRARALMEIFGVSSDETAASPLSRGLRLVIDMRDSDYSFESIKDPVITREISKMVQQNSVHQFSATLLWDASRVIEFDGGDVRVFD